MVPIMKGRFYNSKKNNFVTATVALIVIVNQLLVVMAIYIPYGDSYGPSGRRSDSEEDDMDQTASAPYQQGGNNAGGSDGYEENEPDGPYGETPREEEGQADMEKFFDDHLGASERDGMDKENLPTNLKPLVFASRHDSPMIGPMGLIETQNGQFRRRIDEKGDYNEDYATVPYAGPVSLASTRYSNIKLKRETPDVDTKYIKLPNRKLLITHQITSDLLNNPKQQKRNTNDDPTDDNSEAETRPRSRNSPQTTPSGGGLDSNGSGEGGRGIVAVEDEDMDKIYVTNMTNQPFRIDALGGYDPEEDFQEASRDIEEPGKMQLVVVPRGRRRERLEEAQVTKDITFNDPEADTLFNDASETDEVTFAYHDDPYQSDLEVEMQGQPSSSYDNSPYKSSRRQMELDDLDYNLGDSKEKKLQPRRGSDDDDDSEGSWVNDGVDDMDVPSQAYQDSVLDKAAKQQALAERNAAADNRSSQQQDANPDESDNQRMQNADYMKDDLKEVDGDKA